LPRNLLNRAGFRVFIFMSCTGASDIGLFATGLWTNIGQPSDISALTISGFVAQPSTLGALNAYIGTCYSGDGVNVCPDLDEGSFAIIGLMYLQSYYMSLMRANAGAGGTLRLVELREGDSTIRWVNASEIAKTYSAAAKDAASQLKYLVKAYNNNSQGGNTPRAIDFPLIINGG
jgi:hypothetical protein